MSSIFARLGKTTQSGAAPVRRVGVVDGVFDALGGVGAVQAHFPDIMFESVGPAWPTPSPNHLDVLIVPVAAGSPEMVADALSRLARPSLTRVIVALRDADVATTHRLARGGAADVLPTPFTEASVALCLERTLASHARGAGRETGEVIAFLKAGGGVGATSLLCQCAVMLAGRDGAEVCVADLDVQFGDAGLHLDMPRSTSIANLLSLGSDLADTPFIEALGAHRSGLKLLAAPDDIMGLDTLGAEQIESLIEGLKRDFRTTLIDLPGVWTAWTTAALDLSDRIVIVTHLTVPHIQMVKRQLGVLATLNLDDRPIILVCNQVSGDQQASLSIKAAERALGRSFDVVVPEDRKIMTAATNQGVEIGAVQRGSKLQKAVTNLADLIGGPLMAKSTRQGQG